MVSAFPELADHGGVVIDHYNFEPVLDEELHSLAARASVTEEDGVILKGFKCIAAGVAGFGVELHESPGDGIARHQGGEGHGADRDEGEHGEEFGAEVSGAHAEEGEEEGKFTGLGKEDAGFEGGAGGVAEPLGEEGDEEDRDEDEDQNKDEAVNRHGGGGEGQDKTDADKKEGEEETGEGMEHAPDESIHGEGGEDKAREEGPDEVGEVEEVGDCGKGEEGGEGAEHEGFFIGAEATADPGDKASVEEEGGGTEGEGFEEGGSAEEGSACHRLQAYDHENDKDVLHEENAHYEASVGFKELAALLEVAHRHEGRTGGKCRANIESGHPIIAEPPRGEAPGETQQEELGEG